MYPRTRPRCFFHGLTVTSELLFLTRTCPLLSCQGGSRPQSTLCQSQPRRRRVARPSRTVWSRAVEDSQVLPFIESSPSVTRWVEQIRITWSHSQPLATDKSTGERQIATASEPGLGILAPVRRSSAGTGQENPHGQGGSCLLAPEVSLGLGETGDCGFSWVGTTFSLRKIIWKKNVVEDVHEMESVR